MKPKNLKRFRFFKNKGLYFLYLFYSKTIQLYFKSPLDSQGTSKPYILAIYHESVVSLMRVFGQLNKNPNNLFLLISSHQDGDLVSEVAEKLGIKYFRLSKGHHNLKEYVRQVREFDYIPVIAIDGPVGPYHSVQEGVLYLQEQLKRPIRLMWFLGKGVRLNSWDKHFFPYPFSKVRVYLSKAFSDETSKYQNRKERLASFKTFLRQPSAL